MKLPFDHVYPPLSQTLDPLPLTAILYASFPSANFRPLHEYLMREAADAKLEYILRYVSPSLEGTRGSPLSGYGVALDLKKTDYLAVDDRLASTSGRIGSF